MTYQRRTVWASQSPLTAADLNEEFDAIAAAIQEIASSVGAAASSSIVLNAADPAFNPTGNGSRAERVAEAMAAAVSGGIKVVWIPRTMWGYAEDAEWSAGIFDASVLVVREGALYPVYDPIAYGAKIDDTGFNNTPVFQLCFDLAAATTDGPGMKIVAVTVPGAYQLDGNVTRPFPPNGGYWLMPFVTFTGAGSVTGVGTQWDLPIPIVSMPKVLVRKGVGQPVAAGSQTVLVQFADTDVIYENPSTWFDQTNSNTTFIADTPGQYLITASILFHASLATGFGTSVGRIKVSNVIVATSHDVRQPTNNTTHTHQLSVMVSIDGPAGIVLELEKNDNAGNILAGSRIEITRLA